MGLAHCWLLLWLVGILIREGLREGMSLIVVLTCEKWRKTLQEAAFFLLSFDWQSMHAASHKITFLLRAEHIMHCSRARRS